MLVQALKDLIRSFDNKNGVPEATYNATCDIICAVWNNTARELFGKHIDATEGQFYFKENVKVEKLLVKMENAA